MIAHPAAIALTLFLRRLHVHDPIRRSVMEIFAPASEHGARAWKSCSSRPSACFRSRACRRAIFDTQSAFNLLARYGEEAPARLEDSELRIERHLATLLALPGDGEGPPMPSLRLIQAPVFHGYSFSAWVEFENNPGMEALESGLVSAHIEVRGADFEPPTNVGQAGQGGIAVGAIAPDRNNAGGLLVLGGGGQPAPGGRKRGGGGEGVRMSRRSSRSPLRWRSRRMRLSRGRPSAI